MKGHGLKQVRNRRDDALARVRWDKLEALLADYYATQGFRVEHVGTGGTRQRFDGGIDLKLRKDDQYILVQCKGWNAYQVPHNEVHQLIGLMVNEGATGAILVTSGEFTRAAIEAAAKSGYVQLVDGDDLREMLGPLPESVVLTHSDDSVSSWKEAVTPAAKKIAVTVGDRLLSAAEDRIRGAHGRGGAAQAVTYAVGAKLMDAFVSFVLFVLLILFVVSIFKSAFSSAGRVIRNSQIAPVPAQANSTPAARYVPISPVPAVSPRVEQEKSSPPSRSGQRREYTPDEIRVLEKKAEEAMKVIESTTPEV